MDPSTGKNFEGANRRQLQAHMRKAASLRRAAHGRAYQKAFFKGEMARLDSSGDNQLSAAELAAGGMDPKTNGPTQLRNQLRKDPVFLAYSRNPTFIEKEATVFLAAMDTADATGGTDAQLSLAEFQWYMQHSGMQLPQTSHQQPNGSTPTESLFAAHDTNKDGALDEAEIQAFLFPSDSETSGDHIAFMQHAEDRLVSIAAHKAHFQYDRAEGEVPCALLQTELGIVAEPKHGHGGEL